MKILDVIAGILLLIGGLNWGLIGVADFNLVSYLFGELSDVSRVIYVLVGLAALYRIFFFQGIRKRWSVKA